MRLERGSYDLLKCPIGGAWRFVHLDLLRRVDEPTGLLRVVGVTWWLGCAGWHGGAFAMITADILLGIIAAALLYLAAQPAIHNWQMRRRRQSYRRAVLANGWFDPEINPDAKGPVSILRSRNSGSTS